MGLTLNMVGGGGSWITPTDAVLFVQAPAGSTVTISKGAVTKTDLGHVNAFDNTMYDYYFAIHQSQFDSVNPWTVTATLSGESTSNTVVINSSKEYYVFLNYDFLLYYNGEFSSDFSRSNITTNGSITENASSITLHSNASAKAYVYVRWVAVDLTNKSTITASFYNTTTRNIYISIWVASSSSVVKYGDANYKIHQNLDGSSSKTISLDVSSAIGTWYVAAGIDTNDASWDNARNVYLYSVVATS